MTDLSYGTIHSRYWPKTCEQHGIAYTPDFPCPACKAKRQADASMDRVLRSGRKVTGSEVKTVTRITIDGESFKVVENLGFQHSAGHYAKLVETPEGERMAVKRHGGRRWRFWTAEDRTAPLRQNHRWPGSIG